MHMKLRKELKQKGYSFVEHPVDYVHNPEVNMSEVNGMWNEDVEKSLAPLE